MASLHSAARSGDMDAVVALIAGGADVDAEEDGRSRPTALHLASARGHAGIVRVLIDGGADLDKLTPAHRTPLWLAANNCNMVIMNMLLAAGADPNIGESSYAAVLFRGHRSGLALLLQHGAAVSATIGCSVVQRDELEHNASAWRFHDRVVEAGGYGAFKAIHRRLYASLLPKFFEAKFRRRAPNDACGVVASFLSHGQT